jgi:hypothetical protein
MPERFTKSVPYVIAIMHYFPLTVPLLPPWPVFVARPLVLQERSSLPDSDWLCEDERPQLTISPSGQSVAFVPCTPEEASQGSHTAPCLEAGCNTFVGASS